MSPFWYKIRCVLMHLRPGPSVVGANMIMEGWADWEIDIEEADIRRMQMQDFKALLLQAPEGQLDASMKPLIEKWDKTPKAVQVLEVLDQCIHASLASGFTIRLLQLLYDTALTNEGLKHEDVIPLATWRA